MTEQWHEIDEFPGYMVSNLGQIYNKRTEKVMRLSSTQLGDLKVSLNDYDGHRVTRSVRALVAEAFVYRPDSIFDTVIVLDNNRSNVAASNLAWRPRWFAWNYSVQFGSDIPQYYKNVSVINLRSKERFESIEAAAVVDGCLMKSIWASVNVGCTVFPTGDTYAIL